MTGELLAMDGYEPEGLLPIPQELVPFHVGETVAFREDHPEFGVGEPSTVDEGGHVRTEATAERHAMYGQIKAIGYDDGEIVLDLLVFDPHFGITSEDTTIRRVSVTGGEIQ